MKIEGQPKSDSKVQQKIQSNVACELVLTKQQSRSNMSSISCESARASRNVSAADATLPEGTIAKPFATTMNHYLLGSDEVIRSGAETAPVKLQKSRLLFLNGDTDEVDIEPGVGSPSPEASYSPV